MQTLTHHFLLPTEAMQDARFFDCVLYICRHTKDGAWGFIINKPSDELSVGMLLTQANIDAGKQAMDTPAMVGGVLRTEAGFILHTGLPDFQSSYAIGENLCLTTSRDILPRLAPNSQFAHFLLLMGFCHWEKGQLEAEVLAGSWLSLPASSEIIFHHDNAEKMPLIYATMGISPSLFTPTIGQA